MTGSNPVGILIIGLVFLSICFKCIEINISSEEFDINSGGSSMKRNTLATVLESYFSVMSAFFIGSSVNLLPMVGIEQS